MSTDNNKAIVRRFLEEFYNQGNWSLAEELLAEEFVNHDPNAPHVRDRQGLVEYFQALRRGFPDAHTTEEALIAEGDNVVKRYISRGTHTGEFNGIPPTGKPVAMSGLSMYRIRDGKVHELWWSYDVLGLLQQIGVVQVPEQAAAT